MRVWQAFLIILASVILFLLPLTDAMYDFKTDRQEDSFSTSTAAGQTTANLTLSESVFDDDTTTIEITSDLSTDSPAWSSYNATSHSLLASGLTANTTRNLTLYYDVDALGGSDAIVNLADKMAWIWLLIIIAFIPAALAAIFIKKA